ncbi:unnamed protein product, partial [Amoebophrya sp. A25]|eukprot:GSA25T00027257001.1
MSGESGASSSTTPKGAAATSAATTVEAANVVVGASSGEHAPTRRVAELAEELLSVQKWRGNKNKRPRIYAEENTPNLAYPPLIPMSENGLVIPLDEVAKGRPLRPGDSTMLTQAAFEETQKCLNRNRLPGDDGTDRAVTFTLTLKELRDRQLIPTDAGLKLWISPSAQAARERYACLPSEHICTPFLRTEPSYFPLDCETQSLQAVFGDRFMSAIDFRIEGLDNIGNKGQVEIDIDRKESFMWRDFHKYTSTILREECPEEPAHLFPVDTDEAQLDAKTEKVMFCYKITQTHNLDRSLPPLRCINIVPVVVFVNEMPEPVFVRQADNVSAISYDKRDQHCKDVRRVMQFNLP